MDCLSLLNTSIKNALSSFTSTLATFAPSFDALFFSCVLSFGFPCWLALFCSFATVSMSHWYCSNNSSILILPVRKRLHSIVLLVEYIHLLFSLTMPLPWMLPCRVANVFLWFIHTPLFLPCGLVAPFLHNICWLKLLAPEPCFFYIQCLPFVQCFLWIPNQVIHLVNMDENVFLWYLDHPLG